MCCLHRYMAIWRGRAMARVRRSLSRSACFRLKWSATVFWISSTVMRRSGPPRRATPSRLCASSTPRVDRRAPATAARVFTAPSSSRIEPGVRSTRCSSTSARASPETTPSLARAFRRDWATAIFSVRSAASTGQVRPAARWLRRRGSTSVRAVGARSADRTMRLPSSISEVRVLSSSSWVLVLPPTNWTSSSSSMSAERRLSLKAAVERSCMARTKVERKRSAVR
ncbi:hypothetical protein D3C72_1331490 [compost metagenome]